MTTGILINLDGDFVPQFVVRIVGSKMDSFSIHGTGFFVTREGHVVTCWHVLYNESGEPKFEHVFVPDGNDLVPYSVMEERRGLDLVVLVPTTDTPPKPRIPVALVRDSTIIKKSQTYSLYGFSNEMAETPGDFDLKFTNSLPSAKRLQFQTSINHGDSGGPIVLKGTCALAAIAQAKSDDRQGVGTAIPVLVLVDLLKSLKTIPFLTYEPDNPHAVPWASDRVLIEREADDRLKLKEAMLNLAELVASTSSGDIPIEEVEKTIKPVTVRDNLASKHHRIDREHIDEIVDHLFEQTGEFKKINLVVDQSLRWMGEQSIRRILERASEISKKLPIKAPIIKLDSTKNERVIGIHIVRTLDDKIEIRVDHDDDDILEMAADQIASSCSRDQIHLFEFTWSINSADRSDQIKHWIDQVWSRAQEKLKERPCEEMAHKDWHILFIIRFEGKCPDSFACTWNRNVEKTSLFLIEPKTFTSDDINLWLKTWSELDEEQATYLTKILFEFTEGDPKTLSTDWNHIMDSYEP